MKTKKKKKLSRRDPWDILKEKTHRAFCNPKKGDRFHEMYSAWMYVVKTTKKWVYTLSASAPCTFPTDGELEKMTREQFKSRFRSDYSTKKVFPSYYYDLCDRGQKVAGWMRGKKAILYVEEQDPLFSA